MIIGKHYITREEKIAKLERLRRYSFFQPVRALTPYIHNQFIVVAAMSSYGWAVVRAKFYQRVLKKGVKAAEILLDSMAYTSELGKRISKNL